MTGALRQFINNTKSNYIYVNSVSLTAIFDKYSILNSHSRKIISQLRCISYNCDVKTGLSLNSAKMLVFHLKKVLCGNI